MCSHRCSDAKRRLNILYLSKTHGFPVFNLNHLVISLHLCPSQPEELTNVLEICNIVFTSMFTLEMILKLTAFGFFEYLRNPYNIFDGIIVIIRLAIMQLNN